MIGPRKIYVESSRAQGGASDFVYSLSQSISCPVGTRAVIDEVLVPNTFYTVDSTRCHLYIRETTVGDGAAVQDVRATIATGNYSAVELVTAVTNALNEGKSSTFPSYTVAYKPATGLLEISNPTTGSFKIKTRAELLALGSWAGTSFGKEPNDACAVIGLDASATDAQGKLSCKNLVSLMPLRNVYLCSSDFGLPNQSIGPSGQTYILRKVPVEQSWGNLLHSQHATDLDWIDVGGQQLQSLGFSLRDEQGRLLDLKGQPCSFTIQLLFPDQ